MNTLVIVLIAAVCLFGAYTLYGRWLANKWGIDPTAKTPAVVHEDGRDYVPTNGWTVFAHQFSSIAGAGPVTGAIQAAAFGWLPVLLWVLIGGIFFGAVTDFGALRGCDARVWSFFRRFNKDAEKYYDWCAGKSNEPMPLYIIPDRKVSLQDMQARMRDHFEDTPFNMTSDPGMGPDSVPYRWRPMDYTVNGKNYCMERAIATQQTGWHFVSQSRANVPDPVGGILWFGTDDTNTSVYMPFYCSLTEIPEEVRVGNGDLLTFSPTSNFWMTNWVANQAYNRYDLMIPDIRRVQGALEEGFIAERAGKEAELIALYEAGNTDALQKAVNADAAKVAKKATDSYRDLGQYLLVRFLDGNRKKVNADHSFKRSATGMPVSPDFPGYNKAYYENIVNKTGDHFLVPKGE